MHWIEKSRGKRWKSPSEKSLVDALQMPDWTDETTPTVLRCYCVREFSISKLTARCRLCLRGTVAKSAAQISRVTVLSARQIEKVAMTKSFQFSE